MSRFLNLCMALAIALTPHVAAGQTSPVSPDTSDCSSPSRALATWLVNLQPQSDYPNQAIRCFAWEAAGVTDADRQELLARRLKRLADAGGHEVVYATVEADQEAEGFSGPYQPFEDDWPLLELTQVGSEWLISSDTIHGVLNPGTTDRFVEAAPGWLQQSVFGQELKVWNLAALLAWLLVGLLVRFIVSRIVRSQATRLIKRIVKNIDEKLLYRMAQPVGTAVMALCLQLSLSLLRLPLSLSTPLKFGLKAAVGISLLLVVYRLVDVGADMFAKGATKTESKLDDQLVPLLRKAAKVIVVVSGGLAILQNLDIDTTSIVGSVTLGGLAFSLAAQDTVSNLFGSVSIFADQPFQVGDWVKVNDVEGVVEEVGMRSTRVRTFYRSLVSIPNSKIADAKVENYGARDCRRTFLKLGLEYDTTPEQIEAFCDGARAILANNPGVKKDSYYVVFSGFADSALEIMVYFFFDVDTWDDELRQRHLIYLEFLRLARELGVEYAFPTQTLHIASQASAQSGHAATPPSIADLARIVQAFGPQGELARPQGPSISHGFRPGYTKMLSHQGTDDDADVGDSRE